MPKLYRPMINGVLLSTYKAMMLSYEVGEVEYDNGYFLAPRSTFPVLLDAAIGLRPVSITLDVEGENRHELTKRISDLTALLHKESDLFLPDGFHYLCAFDGQTTPKEKAPWILQVEYNFQAVRHGGLQRLTLKPGAGTKRFFVEGNYRTPARYVFTPKASGSITIGEITIQKLKAQEQVVIDGIRKTVKANGVNVFGNTNITEFPKLEYGVNELMVVDDVDVTIEYYPLYL